MTGAEMLAIDARVCAILAKRPGESLNDAAGRILKRGVRGARYNAAHALLTPGEPWSRMQAAIFAFEAGR